MNWKILIVDDEIHVCRLIAKFISDSIECCRIDFAHNGVSAYDYITENKPQIVITDIRIPGMDGIQLVEKAYCANLETKFIIVSGYKKFEYAHNALKFGVLDYLLKPIKEKELLGAVNNVIEKIKLSDESDYLFQRMQRENMEYQKTIISDALTGLLENRDADPKVLEYPFRCFYTFAVQLCIEERLCGNKEFFHMVFKNISGIIRAYFMPPDFYVSVFLHENCIVTVINFQRAKEKNVKNGLKETGNAVKHWAMQHNGLNVSMGVSLLWEALAQFRDSYAQALDSACVHLLAGFNKVFWSENYVDKSKDIFATLIPWRKRFLLLLEDYSEMRCKLYIDELYCEVLQMRNLHPKCLYDIYNEHMDMVSKYTATLSLENIRPLEKICHSSTAASYKAFFDEMAGEISAYLQYVDEEKRKIEKLPVMLAKQYVQKHMKDDLNLDKVAAAAHLSPIYFSAMFKKLTGMNFSDYVMKERMEQAKHLLVNTTMNVSEIAMAVGYSDLRAFSKRFKKEVGIVPSEFRAFHFDSNIDWWE